MEKTIVCIVCNRVLFWKTDINLSVNYLKRELQKKENK